MTGLFEPCSISKMLSMRIGNPRLVYINGWLKDPVIHMKTASVFDGETYDKKIGNMFDSLKEAIDLFNNDRRK